MSERVVVISGVTGAGKTEIARAVERRIMVRKVISCTTRSPRPGEVDGREYHFLSKDYFMGYVAMDEFVEHSPLYGNFYGTLRADIEEHLASPEIAMLVMDIQGLEKIARMYPAAQTFFLNAPMQDLIRRHRVRETTEAEREERKQSLAGEIMLGVNSPQVQNIIHNRDGDFDGAVEQICHIIEKRVGHSLARL